LLRSILLVGGGAAGGQVILLITSLVIARLYSPDELGAFVTLSAMASIVAVFLTGRYELAIPIPQNDEEGISLGRLAMALAICGSAALTVLLGLTQGLTAPTWMAPALGIYWGLPALALGLAVMQIGSSGAVRARKYRSLATRSLVFPVVAGALQIAAGFSGLGAPGLIGSVALGQASAFLLTWFPAIRSMRAGKEGSGRRDSTKRLAWAYVRFPALLAPAGAVNAFAAGLPVLLISALFGLAAGGQYGMATKLLVAPVALIGQTIGFVYSGEVARMSRGRVRSVEVLYRATSLRLLGAGLLVFGIVVLAAPWGIELLLGDKWREAGVFARIMSFGVMAQLIAAPLSQTLIIAQMQRAQIMSDLLRVALIAGAGLCAYLLQGTPVATAAGISVASAIGYGVTWFLNRLAARRLDRA
jgi:O-antigen/teichoic acid export membrane protein